MRDTLLGEIEKKVKKKVIESLHDNNHFFTQFLAYFEPFHHLLSPSLTLAHFDALRIRFRERWVFTFSGSLVSLNKNKENSIAAAKDVVSCGGIGLLFLRTIKRKNVYIKNY